MARHGTSHQTTVERLHKAYLNKSIQHCSDFQALNLEWEFVFNANSKFTEKARQRRRQRGAGKFPKIRRLIRILSDVDIEILRQCPDVEWCEKETEDEPLYAPTDPNGLNYAWTKQTLTHATNTTAFDLETGSGIVIGIIESAGAGADYTDSELGGTGNQATDWAAIQAGTHAKFVNYTNPVGTSIDPYGTGHGDTTSRQAVAVMDNANAYCGSCPEAKVMMAVGQDFDEAIQRMSDLGVDVISVSYTNAYSHRTAIQYATAAGVIVVYTHGSNSHTELSVEPFESLLIGGFSTGDVSDRSYGIGLTVCGRGASGSQESWSTPATAGIVGLILALNPTWSVWDVYACLIQTSTTPSGMGGAIWHIEYGWGIPDAYNALQTVLADIKPLPVIDFEVAVSGLGIQLSWTNLPITNFDHFEVRRKENSYPTDETDGTLVYSGTDLTYHDALALSGDWYYSIWGVDTSSQYSEYPASTEFYTKENVSYSVSTPEINTITDTDTTITLTWGDLLASGYKVYWDTDSGEPYANELDVGDVLTYTIESLTEGQQYFVTISAYDDESNGTDKADEVTTVTGTPDLAYVGVVSESGTLKFVFPLSDVADFAGITIEKDGQILTENYTASQSYYDTQAWKRPVVGGNIYSIYAKDESGNESQKWIVISKRERITIATKGGTL